MKTKNIALSPEAITAIEGLQHSCGTYSFYTDTLSRLYNFILTQSEEIGMDDTETLHTLRSLHFLKADLAYIAGRDRTPTTYTPATEEAAERVEATFEDFQDSNGPGPVDKLDEPREMLADVKRAWQRVNEAQNIISEAIIHAQNAGDKYESVIYDLADVNGDMEALTASLDAVMAIDPDPYEPKELTYADKAERNILRALDTIAAVKEHIDDALDQAQHSTEIDNSARNSIKWAQGLTAAAAGAIAELSIRNNLTGEIKQ